MNQKDIRLIKKKYRINYIARVIWSLFMTGVVYYKFDGTLLLLCVIHLLFSLVWVALVETEAPVIFVEDTRYFRISMDAFLYTVAIYITGGVNSFCLLSYIIFIMLASLYTTIRYGIFAIIICVACYNTMLFLVHSGYLPYVNILSPSGEGFVQITRSSVLFTNFLLITVSVIMNIAAHSFYTSLMNRTSELQTERNRLHERNTIIENDIKLAKKIQKQLIPQVNPYPFIYSAYKPMEKVGGDFFDFLDFRNSRKTGIFLSDVSGHGVPAAFITSMIKTLILQSGISRENPAKLLMYLNGILNGKTAENFITAFYGIYDMQLKTFLFSNAGHNTPFLLTDKKLKPLNEARSIPLAIIDNEFLVEMKKDYQNYEIKVNSGDRILLYTDGLTEENGSDGRHDSFEDYMTEEFLPAHRSMSIKQIVDGLMTDLERWSGSENFKDDVCIICMEIT